MGRCRGISEIDPLILDIFKPRDKVIVKHLNGKEFKGIVVLTEAHVSGNKVRVRCGDFILNLDEKQVSRDE
jgi:hypothetical protein